MPERVRAAAGYFFSYKGSLVTNVVNTCLKTVKEEKGLPEGIKASKAPDY